MRCFLSLCLLLTVAAASLRSRGSFALAEPAFIKVVGGDLIITSFSGSPFTAGSLWRVAQLSTAWAGNVTQIKPVQISSGASKLLWPNNITPSPALPLGGFVFGDGFLPPGKSNGGLYWVQNGTDTVRRLTAPLKDYFYHRGVFFDVNGDGRDDIITARASKPLLGGGRGELVWLEQPADATQVPWPTHHLADGPDIDFAVVPTGATGSAMVFAAEFFGKRLVSIALSAGVAGNITVIDDTQGPMYTVRATHMFGDSRWTLLADSYHYSGNGSVLLYASNSLRGPWQRTLVASAFHNVQFAPGSGAPGWLYPHYPRAGSATGTQSFFVCGDGSEQFSLFEPTAPDAAQWRQTYNENYRSTVGAAAVGDFDGDGWTDALVTDYNNGRVHAYTYAPL